MCLLLLAFFTLLSITSALPPKGCASCLLVPIERHSHSGQYEVEKKVDRSGCFVQRLTCRGNKSTAETFVQFNHGAGGYLTRGEQVVDIECTNDGHWRFARGDSKSIVVESLACLST